LAVGGWRWAVQNVVRVKQALKSAATLRQIANLGRSFPNTKHKKAMKINYTLCFAAMLISSLLSGQYDPNATLIDIPTSAHQRSVEVYFLGESKPAKPYLRLAYIAMGKGYSQNLTPTIESLKQRAQLLGADAIIILGGTNRVRVVNIGEWVEEQVVSDLEALAVVYPENLKYIPGCIKSRHILQQDSLGKRWEIMGSEFFTLKGSAAGSAGNLLWLNWWKKLSHARLLDTSWRYTTDEYGRKSNLFPTRDQRIKIFYTSENSRIIKKLNLFTQGNFMASIAYTYEKDNQTIKYREIVEGTNKSRSYLEFPEYGAGGNISSYLILTKHGSATAQFLRVEYEYYTPEEWDAAVQKLVSAQIGE